MILCFVTAGLLVAVQSQSGADDRQGALTPDESAMVAVRVIHPLESRLPDPNAPPLAQFGLAPTLQAALNPQPSAEQASLVVNLGLRQLQLFRGGVLEASYPIAVGRDGWETPTGEFRVMHMEHDPIWQHPFTGAIVPAGEADNPLGSRWVGFWSDGKHQIGFHGTNQAALIGQAVSHGCLRMHNADIEAIYDQVAIGTPVSILP